MNKKQGSSQIGYTFFVLSILVSLCFGLLAGVIIFTPAPPVDLAGADTLEDILLSERLFDDQQQVTVTINIQNSLALSSEASGRITYLNCEPAQQIDSGTSTVAINGKSLVNFFTEVPLWRDLSVGDKGKDAFAVNQELDRLGYPAGEGETITAKTITGFRELITKIGGIPDSTWQITLTSILWIPAPDVLIDSCEKNFGEHILAQDSIMTLQRTLRSALINSEKERHLEGERYLVLGAEEILVSEHDGLITDADSLSKIASTAEYKKAARDSDGNNVQIVALWKLVNPINTAAVPPSSLIGLDGDTACVLTDGKMSKVTLIGSELGQSFILFEGNDFVGKTVAIFPPQDIKCS